jgi:hypothetical protein
MAWQDIFWIFGGWNGRRSDSSTRGKRTRLRRLVSAPSAIIAIVFGGSPRVRRPRAEADPPAVAGLHATLLPLQSAYLLFRFAQNNHLTNQIAQL